MLTAGGLVGALAIGALVLAGPMAQAATATSATSASPQLVRPDGACGNDIANAIALMNANGLTPPNPATPQNVAYYLAVYTQNWQGSVHVYADYLIQQIQNDC